MPRRMSCTRPPWKRWNRQIGRVDRLVVRADAHVWQTMSGEEDESRAPGERRPGDVDLVDWAVSATLRNGGEVEAWSAEEMPANALVVARYRYPAAPFGKQQPLEPTTAAH